MVGNKKRVRNCTHLAAGEFTRDRGHSAVPSFDDTLSIKVVFRPLKLEKTASRSAQPTSRRSKLRFVHEDDSAVAVAVRFQTKRLQKIEQQKYF